MKPIFALIIDNDTPNRKELEKWIDKECCNEICCSCYFCHRVSVCKLQREFYNWIVKTYNITPPETIIFFRRYKTKGVKKW